MSTKIAIIAENQYKDVELQLKHMQVLNEYAREDLIIVSIDGEDGLDSYLLEQEDLDYLICGYQDSYGDIINVIKNVFMTQGQNLVVINASSFLLPNAISAAESIIQKKEAVGGLVFHNYDNTAMTYEEAKDQVMQSEERLAEACVGNYSEGIFFSAGWLESAGDVDNLLMLPENALTDYAFTGMKKGYKMYTTPNVGKYGVTKTSDKYCSKYGPDCDRDRLYELWGSRKIVEILDDKLLSFISAKKDDEFTVLIDNCSTGEVICQIRALYPNALFYGIEGNKKLSYISLGHDGVKRIYPNVDRVDMPPKGYDYIITCGYSKYNEETRELFKKYEKLLAADGKLLFKAKNAVGIKTLHQMFTSGSFDEATAAFTLESIITETEMSGLMVTDIDTDRYDPDENEVEFMHEAKRLVNATSEEIFWVDNYYVKAEKQPCHNIRSDEETIELLLQGYSMARFGDGEYTLALEERGLRFQKLDLELSRRIREVIQNTDNDKLLVAIAENAGDLTHYYDYAANVMHEYTYSHRKGLELLIPRDKVYSNTNITRFYVWHKDNLTDAAQKRADSLRQLWEGRDVIFVEGAETRLGVGNDYFENAASIRRIEGPPTSTYDRYNEIYEACMQAPKDALFLLAIGPCAGVLAYDLSKEERQAIDIGHLDMEYMWYKAGKGRRVPVKNKYNNEVSGGDKVKNEGLSSTFYEQIIADFSNV